MAYQHAKQFDNLITYRADSQVSIIVSHGAMINSIHRSSVPTGKVYPELQKALRMCHLLCLESSKVCRYGESVEMLCVFH